VTRTLTAGLVLAVAAAAGLLLGDVLGWDLDAVVLLGAAAGGVLGLVGDRSPVARLLGFLLGAVAAAIGYALRAAVLPDTTSARAVAVVLVILIATGIAAVSFGRLPLWSLLLGAAALAGAYEEIFTDSPGSLVSTLPVWLTSVLIMSAIGFAATVFFSGSGDEQEPQHQRRGRAASPSPQQAPDEESVGLDEVLHKGGN
jgi:hypothetical protein